MVVVCCKLLLLLHAPSLYYFRGIQVFIGASNDKLIVTLSKHSFLGGGPATQLTIFRFLRFVDFLIYLYIFTNNLDQVRFRFLCSRIVWGLSEVHSNRLILQWKCAIDITEKIINYWDASIAFQCYLFQHSLFQTFNVSEYQPCFFIVVWFQA